MTGGFDELLLAVDKVTFAEKLAVPGTPDYDMIVKAALYQAWPTIRAYVEMNRPSSAGAPVSYWEFMKRARAGLQITEEENG